MTVVRQVELEFLPPYLPSPEEQEDPVLFAGKVSNVQCALCLGLSDFPSEGYRTSDFAFFRENRTYIDIEKLLGQKIRQAY